eukprot:CAMPEP_0171105704 /NCGR_PEP_ID=MMETSP0766_2-20121228/63268_1 /TAXON_ID=439317 /ORGANISM="Gambierdiscus australes, Strain CAWD 149" /LENGTH=142 /DNA_ID=CAMNT_0011566629 /DNA_START=23 /DNA_END=448 /DNA_ORIENTATION=+
MTTMPRAGRASTPAGSTKGSAHSATGAGGAAVTTSASDLKGVLSAAGSASGSHSSVSSAAGAEVAQAARAAPGPGHGGQDRRVDPSRVACDHLGLLYALNELLAVEKGAYLGVPISLLGLEPQAHLPVRVCCSSGFRGAKMA